MAAFTFPPPPPGAHIVSEPNELEALFSQDRSTHIYSLCNLESAYWPHSRWYRRDDATVGLVGNRPGELITACAVSTVDPDGSAALLAALVPKVRDSLIITGPPGMARALESVRPVTWKTDQVRYELEKPPSQPAPNTSPSDLTRLDVTHTPDLERLYAIEPGAAFFLPSMVPSNTFVGIWDEEHRHLVAAAGTHVVSEDKSIAAIGAVYVRPDQRGRNLGTCVTLGVLDLLANRADTIGLNATIKNTPARRIYEQLGFRPILNYEEAQLPQLETASLNG